MKSKTNSLSTKGAGEWLYHNTKVALVSSEEKAADRKAAPMHVRAHAAAAEVATFELTGEASHGRPRLDREAQPSRRKQCLGRNSGLE